ncbi:MAG: hypothetical protein R3F49_07370 [Planctomycetota bacterium]
MLHLTLLPSLLLPALAPAPRAVADLSLALPSETLAVLCIGDVGAVFGDESRPWGRMLADPRWREILADIAGNGGELEDPEVATLLLDSFVALCADVHAAAIGFPGQKDESFIAVLSAADGWAARLRASFEARGVTCEDVECDAGAAYAFRPDAESVFFVLQAGDQVHLALQGDLEAAQDSVSASIARLAESDSLESPWWNKMDGRVDDALFEVMIGTEAFADIADDAREVLGDLGHIYLSAQLGPEMDAEFLMSLDFGGSPIMESVASAVVPADTTLLGLLPEGQTGAVFGLDFVRVLDLVLELAEEENPSARAEYEAASEAINGLLGIDIESDVILNFTGQVLFVQSADQVATALGADEDDPLAEEMIPVIAFAVEDTDVLLDALGPLFEMAEGQGLELDLTEVDGATLWSFDTGEGYSASLAVGMGFLMVGTESGVADFLEGLADRGRARALADAVVTQLDSELTGMMVTAMDVAAAIEAMSSLVEGANALGELQGQAVPPGLLDSLAAILEVAGDHFSGVLCSVVELTETRIAYRTLLR